MSSSRARATGCTMVHSLCSTAALRLDTPNGEVFYFNPAAALLEWVSIYLFNFDWQSLNFLLSSPFLSKIRRAAFLAVDFPRVVFDRTFFLNLIFKSRVSFLPKLDFVPPSSSRRVQVQHSLRLRRSFDPQVLPDFTSCSDKSQQQRCKKFKWFFFKHKCDRYDRLVIAMIEWVRQIVQNKVNKKYSRAFRALLVRSGRDECQR